MSYIQGLVSTKNIFKKTQVNEAVYRCVMGGKFVRVTITLFCGRVFLTKSIICPSRFWETHSWRTLLETLFHKKGVWSLWRVEICYILIPVPRPPPHECNVGSEISLRISNPWTYHFWRALSTVYDHNWYQNYSIPWSLLQRYHIPDSFLLWMFHEDRMSWYHPCIAGWYIKLDPINQCCQQVWALITLTWLRVYFICHQ